jgi:DNA replication protein DnaC
MEKRELLECIDFFKNLDVFEEDVSTDEDNSNFNKVVIVRYVYKGKSYSTIKLYYKNILQQDNVRNPDIIVKYFGNEVYWLDNEKHDWPKGSGEGELEKTIIDEMVEGNDIEFKSLLRSLANNSKTGYIQRITADGKTAQYHHNLENNNHWHDIILLIKEIISKKGAKVDKRFFSRLIFKWDGDKHTERERSSLAKEVEWKSRAFIDNFYNNIKSIQNIISEMETITILTQKKQIILQGPPGTGKTREAKIIGRELVLPKSISVEDIQKTVNVGHKLKSATDYTVYEVSKIDTTKVTLKLKTGSEYSPSFKEIIKAYEDKLWLGGQTKGNDPYSAALAKHIFENLDCGEHLKLIQFHPAFSYEDFVRGIVAESKGTQIDYVTKDKVMAKFAKEAYKNWKASTEPKEKVAKETWVQDTLEDFKDFLSEQIEDKEEKLMITGKVYINRITENSIRYNSDAWGVDGGVPVSDIIKMYLADTTTRRQIKDNPELTKTAKSLSTYWLEILKLFKKYIADNNLKLIETTTAVSEKKYVLIIDEINRANLPAVLGELIYALEYRGEKVESMYGTEEDGNTLVIPPNLYIIGTMNTSDRSVGHIDYAIRRRFAFIDVLPKVLAGENFEFELFKQVSVLFIQNLDEYVLDNTVELRISEHLSEEFRPEDVWLGHSYFIKNEGDFSLRKKYEIVPILKEYVKDGILKQSAEPIINAL